MTYKMEQEKLDEIVMIVNHYRPEYDVTESLVLEFLERDFEHPQTRDWLRNSSAEDIAWWILDFCLQE